jgi:acetoin utilization protein AcuB
MLPLKKITCIRITDTIEDAIRIIDEQQLLSLPIIDGTKFAGVLSKQYIYEEFFKEGNCEKQEFLQKKVQDFIKTTIETIPEDMWIETAAARFITSKVRFIPIADENNVLLGIVTQQAVFKQYQKMFGEKHNSLVIYTYDIRGTLGKICEAIAKTGGDIRNMMIQNTEVMNLIEVFFRIEAADFGKVVKTLEKHGYDIRDVKYAVPE